MKKKEPDQKKKTSLVGWFLLTLAWLIVFGLGYRCMRQYVPAEKHADILAFISVILALLSLIVTVMIADHFYKLEQQNDEKEAEKRKKTARSLMSVAVLDGVDWLIHEPRDREINSCYRLKEYLDRYEEPLSEMLPRAELQTLLRLTMTVEALIHPNEEEYAVDQTFLFRPWIKPIMASEYSQYGICALNGLQLLNRQTCSLLKHLGVSDESAKYEELDLIYDNNGRLLFSWTDVYPSEIAAYLDEVYDLYADRAFLEQIHMVSCEIGLTEDDIFSAPRTEKITSIYGGGKTGDELTASGIFGWNDLTDKPEIRDGFVKTEAYVGCQKNFKHHGKGMEYAAGRKKKEGIWQNGELVVGKEYAWVFRRSDKDETSEKWGQLHDYIRYRWLQDPLAQAISEEGMDSFFVADLRVLGANAWRDEETACSLRDYLQAHYPKILASLTETEGMF